MSRKSSLGTQNKDLLALSVRMSYLHGKLKQLFYVVPPFTKSKSEFTEVCLGFVERCRAQPPCQSQSGQTPAGPLPAPLALRSSSEAAWRCSWPPSDPSGE